ncbi:MAG: hypothetical protein AAGB22_10245 [Bacteroidota bacterium]
MSQLPRPRLPLKAIAPADPAQSANDALIFLLNHRLRNHICNLSSLLLLLESEPANEHQRELRALLTQSVGELEAEVTGLARSLGQQRNVA